VKEIIGDAELYLGDCLAVLPTLGPVDHVITDPPYDAHTASSFTGGRHRGRQGFAAEKVGIAFGSLESLEWLEAAQAQCARWIVAWCALEQLAAYKAIAPEWYVRGGFWDRTDGAPQFSGDRPAQPGEACALLHRPGKKRWNGGGRRAFWSGGRSREGGNAGIGHPTPKPLWLMTSQIDLFTESGEIILDPFMGSGTTGVACANLGRRFIGIEIEPRYYEIACERIDAAQRQARLFT